MGRRCTPGGAPLNGPVRSAGGVRQRARRAGDLAALDRGISDCFACPRLVRWREEVAREKRAAFREETYWGRPVPGFGPADATIAVLGLAPAAHGANRTGRVFTGDRSGDWLFASMHRVGLANQPTSTHVDDGLELRGVRVLAAVRCAPPANKPTPAERDACAPWMDRELALLAPTMRVLVCLGGFGWQAGIRALQDRGYAVPGSKFGHGVEVEATHPSRPPVAVLGCYHPSQQNTFTGRLTESMIDAVFARAAQLGATMTDVMGES